MALLRNLHRFISISKIQPPVKPSILKNSSRISFARTASTTQPLQEKNEEVKVTFIRASGERIEAKGKIGDTLLDIVVNNEIDLDGYGACEGTLTCSTCHLIFPKAISD
ncbi:adrenodoxin-like [Fopius arisanus]|uniref:Adrenodoxin-like n=1 Tax=Fopius arisanus TaxID=64838 RepID=A0A9R1U856_9HYME|nr:PREDICTED: adrenodoxin-like [Fopius arisanus]